MGIFEELQPNPHAKKAPAPKKNKQRRKNAEEQARDPSGKFAKGPSMLTRFFMVMQGQHKGIIKRSKAEQRRMERQHRNRMYKSGVAVIPLKKKKAKRRSR